MAGLIIRHGSPNWWTSPDIWVALSPSTSSSPHVENPVAGQAYDVYVTVTNPTKETIGSETLWWNLQAVWAIPTVGPIPLPTSPDSNIEFSSIYGMAGGKSVDFKSLNTWTPVYENGGHECIVAWTNASNIPYPTEPFLDGDAGPGDNWSIAQHNLSVQPVGSQKHHKFHFAFQVCNGADEERGFVIAAKLAPLAEIAHFLPGVPGGRAVLEHPGKFEHLGIVASAEASDSELDHAPAELTIKLAGRSCRRFTLGGLLPSGNALVNVTQTLDGRVTGGISVLVMAEKN
jgi:hypothetical protein